MSADVGEVTYERKSGGLDKTEANTVGQLKSVPTASKPAHLTKWQARSVPIKINMDTGVNIELPRKEICDKSQTNHELAPEMLNSRRYDRAFLRSC